MRLIKRYQNRKLYDTDTKQYITLQEIAELIRQGHDVKVVDNASGDDITTLTLTQIIYEQEKQQVGNLPRSMLTTLIQTSGERFSALQKVFSSSIGYWQQIDEEIKKRIQKLVSQGEISEIDGVNLIDKMLRPSRYRESDQPIQEDVQSALDRRQIPKREEIQYLMEQLDQLADQLDSIPPDEKGKNG